MAKTETGRLGKRLKKWVSDQWHETTIYNIWDTIRDYVIDVFSRWKEVADNSEMFWYGDRMAWPVAVWTAFVLRLLYVFTGTGKEEEPHLTGHDVAEKSSDFLMDKAGDLMNQWIGLARSPLVRGAADTIGTAILDPVLNLLLPPPGTEEIDGKDTAQRFTGMIMGFPIAASLMDTAYSWLPLDGEADFETATNSVYWALGLGFLGWQNLSPALNIALQEPMKRHYNKLYRPKRFSLSTLLDLYMMESIGAGEVYERGAELGWRAGDMRLLIDEAQSLPSRGDLRRMRDRGVIDINEHRNWLKKLGYRAPALNYILQIDTPEIEEDALKLYRSTLKNAYEENLIDSIQFRTHAEDLGWSPVEIDLTLALLDLERENKLKELAKTDVERGYKIGTLTKNDARNILQANDFSPQAVDRLFHLWDAEITEPSRRITSGTVQQAITQGVLDPEHAISLLVDTGYPESDARTIVQTAVEQRVRTPSEATVGAYLRAYRKGLIELDDFREGLRAIGYSESAIALYTSLAETTPGEGDERLTESQALRLYRYGRWTHQETIAWLMEEGHNQEDASDLIWLENRRVEEADVISAYRQRFISQEEAVERLQAIGYTPAMALETLGDVQRRLSKSDILSGMVLGLISTKGAKELLVNLDYTEIDAEFLIVSELFAAGIENVLRRYRNDDISREEAHSRLRILGYGREEARKLLDEAILLPSRLEILRAHKVGLLTNSEAITSLTVIGLSRLEATGTLQTSIRESGKEQVFALWDRDFISENEALNRLEILGYSRADSREALRRERE